MPDRNPEFQLLVDETNQRILIFEQAHATIQDILARERVAKTTVELCLNTPSGLLKAQLDQLTESRTRSDLDLRKLADKLHEITTDPE